MALETLSVFLAQKAVKDMFWVGNKNSQPAECCGGRIPSGSSVHGKGKKARGHSVTRCPWRRVFSVSAS